MALTKPALYTPVALETLAAADHQAGLHQTDRTAIRTLFDAAGPRLNRVINGGMRVAQRTTIGSTDDSWTLDRWTLLLEAANAWTVSQETSDVPTDGSKRALKLTVGASNNNKGGIATYLEFLNVADLRGKSVSLQVKLKASNARIGDVRAAVLEWTGTADSVTSDVVSSWGSAGTNPTLVASWAYLGTPANLSPTTSWATYEIAGLTVGASANNLAVLIWCDDKTTSAADYLLVTDVQLEEGAVCTSVERRPYSQELELCQWYFRRLKAAGTYSPFGNGNLSTTTTLDAVVHYPTMRTAPTATYGTASDFTVLINGGAPAASAVATVAGTSPTPDAISVRATITAQPAAGASGTLAATNSSAYIELSAEM